MAWAAAAPALPVPVSVESAGEPRGAAAPECGVGELLIKRFYPGGEKPKRGSVPRAALEPIPVGQLRDR
jgi:hypothetical protein